MAFQTGSQVRPELGRADVSGFARGGEYLAAGIGAGIKGYKARKDQEKIDQAKVNQAEAFGDATIKLLGEESAEADAIADMLALNFGADVPLSQRAASADNFAKLVSGILDIGQADQPVTLRDIGGGAMGVYQGNEYTGKVITPSQMNTSTSALTTALTDDGAKAASGLREGEVLMIKPDGITSRAVPQEEVQRAQAAGYTFK
jgi:hypothetical protein